ncbi:hypothetical protein OnM2_039006 [Erysiphe neolycopersici]|uniref:Uncharacterized protein n=1 Tax=Erysiphe neolycopersici TaxID=212602 RepID=A0A420HW92_9PEZI|nr:hypothetical protein OnM2_039006 [Erysiphe neolycopersici]
MLALDSCAESHCKSCTICNTPRHVLVRCQIDESGKWHFVCPGKCWNSVSGGEIDAKSCMVECVGNTPDAGSVEETLTRIQGKIDTPMDH